MSIESPFVWAYGMGVDSTAGLVGCHARGIRPDMILFADVGNEKPETYAYLPIIQEWLKKVGFPPVQVVKYKVKKFKHWPPYYSLGQNCLTNGTLPSLAFGFSSCSLKWKVGPQNKFTDQWKVAQKAWAAGIKLTKAIGYDASPADSKRYAHAVGLEDKKYTYTYPLREWGWVREECKARIAEAGLPVPVKSACYFCPAMQKWEVHELCPAQLRGVVALEARAAPRLHSIQGLWRNGVKGTRKPEKKRPGRMTDYIREQGLLSEAEVKEIWNEAPADLIQFQESFAEKQHDDALSVWLGRHAIDA